MSKNISTSHKAKSMIQQFHPSTQTSQNQPSFIREAASEYIKGLSDGGSTKILNNVLKEECPGKVSVMEYAARTA